MPPPSEVRKFLVHDVVTVMPPYALRMGVPGLLWWVLKKLSRGDFRRMLITGERDTRRDVPAEPISLEAIAALTFDCARLRLQRETTTKHE